MAHVKSTASGIIHRLAMCDSCDWTHSDHRDARKLRFKVKAHVLRTGHTVKVETGKTTTYALSE